MKLYYFNPNDYDIEYFVLESSKKDALESLLKYLKNQNDSFYQEEFDRWKDVDSEDTNTYPGSYSIDVFERGQVVMTEAS